MPDCKTAEKNNNSDIKIGNVVNIIIIFDLKCY